MEPLNTAKRPAAPPIAAVAEARSRRLELLSTRSPVLYLVNLRSVLQRSPRFDKAQRAK